MSKGGFRIFYHEYKSVLVFGFFLFIAVLLSCGFSHLIPVDLYTRIINPLQICSLIILCGYGSWIIMRHNGGMRVRQLTSVALGIWVVLLFIMLLDALREDSPSQASGWLSLRSMELIFGNIYAWLLLAYPTELLRPGWLTFKKACLQILPVAIVGIVDYLLPIDLRWLLALYPGLMFVLVIVHIRAYKTWCEENYSSMEDIDVQWVWRYLTMYLIVGISYTYMCFTYEPTRWFTQLWLLFFMIGYSTEQILFRPDPWAEIRLKTAAPSQEVEEEKSEEEEMSPAAYREILEEWMEKKKPYLKPDFRLMDLRQVLPLNRTYLSQLINNEYGCNFYQYITNYRVKEAKKLMRENPEMKMQDVAKQCGFSSPTVFGRVFARETGMTPTQWISNSDEEL